MYNEIHCAYTCTALEYQTFFLFFFSVVPFSPINGPSLNIGQQFNLVSMLDWIRSMLWLYDVISGGHPAVRLGQMTFKIHTVWPTSKHPTLFTNTLSSSLGIFTWEILIVGKCCRHLWVLSPVFNTIPWPFCFCCDTSVTSPFFIWNGLPQIIPRIVHV